LFSAARRGLCASREHAQVSAAGSRLNGRVPPVFGAASAGPCASVERFFQFSLLGLVASGFFALAGSHYLDRPTLALTFVALALRGLNVAGWLKLEIPPKLISAAALGYVLFYPFDFYVLSHDFLTATVHGVCFLAAIKILTAENNRDYLYTGIVAFIELIGAAILSFQAGFFAWLALYILFAMAAFTSAEIRRGLERGEQIVSPPGARLGWRLAIVAVTATAGILVITAGLFLIVPRTARAAAMLFPNAPHVTGFSNVVDLGAFGEISKDTHPVMHILSYSRALPQNLKWRGTALSRFDGKRWSEPPVAFTVVPIVHGSTEVASPSQRSRRDGRRMLYRVDVTNSDTGTLFIAGIPEYINVTAPRLVRTTEDSFRVLPVTGEELSYEVSAHSGPPLPDSERPDWDRKRYLDLPPIDTRIWSQARRWAGEGSALDRALRIQQHLRQDFQYSLETTNQPVRDPLARLLRVFRVGHGRDAAHGGHSVAGGNGVSERLLQRRLRYVCGAGFRRACVGGRLDRGAGLGDVRSHAIRGRSASRRAGQNEYVLRCHGQHVATVGDGLRSGASGGAGGEVRDHAARLESVPASLRWTLDNGVDSGGAALGRVGPGSGVAGRYRSADAAARVEGNAQQGGFAPDCADGRIVGGRQPSIRAHARNDGAARFRKARVVHAARVRLPPSGGRE
jgi:hypothetical protein